MRVMRLAWIALVSLGLASEGFCQESRQDPKPRNPAMERALREMVHRSLGPTRPEALTARAFEKRQHRPGGPCHADGAITMPR